VSPNPVNAKGPVKLSSVQSSSAVGGCWHSFEALWVVPGSSLFQFCGDVESTPASQSSIQHIAVWDRGFWLPSVCVLINHQWRAGGGPHCIWGKLHCWLRMTELSAVLRLHETHVSFLLPLATQLAPQGRLAAMPCVSRGSFWVCRCPPVIQVCVPTLFCMNCGLPGGLA